jgi:hypothetical protein
LIWNQYASAGENGARAFFRRNNMQSSTCLSKLQISFDVLDRLRDGQYGTVDTICPICSYDRRLPLNRKRPVLRTWQRDRGFISYNCARCGAKGFARAKGFAQISRRQTVAQISKAADGISSPTSKNHQREKARWLYHASEPAIGTVVQAYLRLRGITMPLPATIRFLSAQKPEQHPAMLVPFGIPDEPEPGIITISEENITAVQLVLLAANGTGKANTKPNKLTIASPAGMPLVAAAMGDALGLGVAEGFEDALSIHQATGLGVWASGGASFMPKLAPAVPDYTEAVTIFAHADEAGQRHAHEIADLLDARGIEVRIEGLQP